MQRFVPNLRHLRAFTEVADSKSISAASKKIYLSQPAITQAINKLEELVRSPLFTRSSNGMFPTEAGELFLVRVERCLNLLEAGTRESLRLGLRKGGKLPASVEHLISTTQLRALIAVADARNFTLAAQKIGISQPSLHRAARELENLLQISLFEKTSQGIGLSRAAQVLAQTAKLCFAEIKQGFEEVDALHGWDSGSITVGSMPLARTYLLPCSINELTRVHPDTRISVVEGPYEDLLNHLRHGEIDMLIGALRDPLPTDDIVQTELFATPLAIVARCGHPLSDKKSISINELAKYPWVVPRPGTPTREHFESMFKEAGVPVPANLNESSSLILVRGLLLDSDRLTIISAHQILHEERMGLLEALPVEMGHTRRPIGLTTRRDWKPTKTQQLFIDLLKSKAEAMSGQ